MTLRLFVHPLEAHGTTHVSGMSRELNGPEPLEHLEDVAPETVVVAKPDTRPLVAREAGGTGEVQTDVAHRPHHRVELEQRAILLHRLLEVGGPVRGAEPAPGDEVGARRDRRGRVDLQHRQLLHDREQIGRARGVEELRPHCDPPRLLPSVS